MIGCAVRNFAANEADDAGNRQQAGDDAAPWRLIQRAQLVQCQQQRGDRQHQQRGTGRVEPLVGLPRGAARQSPGEGEREQGDRRAKPEHGAPAEMLHQFAGQDGAEDRPQAEDHGVEAEHAGAPVLG